MKELTHRQRVDAMTETLTEIAAQYAAGTLSPLSGVAPRAEPGAYAAHEAAVKTAE